MARGRRRQMLEPGAIELIGMLDLLYAREGESDRAFQARRAKSVGTLRAAREGGEPIPELGASAATREFLEVYMRLNREEQAAKKPKQPRRRKART